MVHRQFKLKEGGGKHCSLHVYINTVAYTYFYISIKKYI